MNTLLYLLEKYQNKITEEANQYLAELNTYQEKTNKIIEDINSKYAININA